jgi:CRP-like cAMP-binding protein
MPDKTELLKTNQILSDLKQEVLEEFARTAKECSYKAGDILNAELVHGDKIFLIAEGTVRVGVELKSDGDEFDHLLKQPGELVGLANFIDESFSHVTETAATDLKVLAWDASEIRAICEAHPEAGYKISMGISKMLINSIMHFNMHLLDSMEWGLA